MVDLLHICIIIDILEELILVEFQQFHQKLMQLKYNKYLNFYNRIQI